MSTMSSSTITSMIGERTRSISAIGILVSSAMSLDIFVWTVKQAPSKTRRKNDRIIISERNLHLGRAIEEKLIIMVQNGGL